MSEGPTFAATLADLQLVREKGLGNIRRYSVPALQAAAMICDLSVSAEQDPASIEALLRKAVADLGGGSETEAAQYSLGLIAGTKLWPKSERRKAAARSTGVGVDRFRKAYEGVLLEQVAEAILSGCQEGRLRQTRVDLEQRHPADSRLAVQWVERFEAYNRVWTPAYKLAADLEAAVATRHEKPQDGLPWDPQSSSLYDPEEQARGYARYALHGYAWFLLEVKRFMSKHGGLWLLSDAVVETAVSDAVYRIQWHNPFNEEDDSWLRRQLADARGEEQDHFGHLLLATSTGVRNSCGVASLRGQLQVFTDRAHARLPGSRDDRRLS